MQCGPRQSLGPRGFGLIIFNNMHQDALSIMRAQNQELRVSLDKSLERVEKANEKLAASMDMLARDLRAAAFPARQQ